MDMRDHYASELGWRLVGMTLAALSSLPGLAAGFLWSREWARAFRELRHAEQVARRLIIAEAGRLITAGEGVPLPASPPTAQRSGGPAPGGDTAQRSFGQVPASNAQLRPPTASSDGPPDGFAIGGDAGTGSGAQPNPSFALFESLPDPLVLAGLAPTGAGERLATLAPAEQKPRETRGLSRRIAALQAVLDDPAPAARRMARFLLTGRVSRASAIPPGHPPAYRRSCFLDWSMDVLLQAHEAACRALNQGWRGPVPEQPG
ncbi:MAG: hypothetical protein AAFQ22_03940 [Pseudomonadota bacterium]